MPTNFHQYHADVNPSQAWYIPGRNAARFLNILLIPLQNFRAVHSMHGVQQRLVRAFCCFAARLTYAALRIRTLQTVDWARVSVCLQS